MNEAPGALVVVAAVAVAVAAAVEMAAVRMRPRRLTVRNHRGLDVPAVLGFAVAAGVAAGTLVAVVFFDLGLLLPGQGDVRWLAAGGAVVFAAGLADDLSGGGPRGLRGHLRSAARGRPTTGLLKALAAVAAGVFCLIQLPSPASGQVGHALVQAGGRSLLESASVVVVVAGCANLWNSLDVAPGRAGKAFAVVAVVLLIVDRSYTAAVALLASGLGSAIGVMAFDLRERGMLGDAGANLLGVLVGFTLAEALAGSAVVAAAAVVVVLNLLAETVTLSRPIRAFPPLRWFDDLGRASG